MVFLEEGVGATEVNVALVQTLIAPIVYASVK